MFRIALLSRWHVHSHKPDERYVKEFLKNPDCKVTCVWDKDEAIAKEWAEEYGVPYEIYRPRQGKIRTPPKRAGKDHELYKITVKAVSKETALSYIQQFLQFRSVGDQSNSAVQSSSQGYFILITSPPRFEDSSA